MLSLENTIEVLPYKKRKGFPIWMVNCKALFPEPVLQSETRVSLCWTSRMNHQP